MTVHERRPITYEECVAELTPAVSKMAAAIERGEWALSARLPLNWIQSIPNSDSPGVYLIFNASGELIYVGKAERPLGLEVWRYLQRGDGDEDVRWKGPDMGSDHPRFIATIRIPDEDCYLAPALEGLLIETLHPKLNEHKKRK